MLTKGGSPSIWPGAISPLTALVRRSACRIGAPRIHRFGVSPNILHGTAGVRRLETVAVAISSRGGAHAGPRSSLDVEMGVWPTRRDTGVWTAERRRRTRLRGREHRLCVFARRRHWLRPGSFQALSAVHTATTVGPVNGVGATRFAAFFGDQRATIYAVDAIDGHLIWKTRVDNYGLAVITGAPALFEGRLYVPVSSREEPAGMATVYPCCTFRGSVVALTLYLAVRYGKPSSLLRSRRPSARTSTGRSSGRRREAQSGARRRSMSRGARCMSERVTRRAARP